MTINNPTLLLSQGFALVAGMIVAIGPQNLFILRQGLQRRHLFITAVTCTLCDLLLLTLGLVGLNALSDQQATLAPWAVGGGMLFLVYYGSRAFHAAFTTPSLVDDPKPAHTLCLRRTLGATLAVSLLNPSAYLETVLLVGSVGGRYPLADRLFFGVGALCASTLWFFGLVYGAAWLAPWLRRPGAGRLLDFVSGTLLWLLASSLWR